MQLFAAINFPVFWSFGADEKINPPAKSLGFAFEKVPSSHPAPPFRLPFSPLFSRDAQPGCRIIRASLAPPNKRDPQRTAA